jgi:multiple sugar transport system permease protein
MALAELPATKTAAAPPPPRSGFAARLKRTPAGLLFLAPAMAIIGVFHFYPLFYAFYISLHNWRIRKLGFVGLDNYRTALETREFWQSFLNTSWFALITVPVTMVVALTLAYLLFQRVRFLGLFRTVYFLPYVTSAVAAAAVWSWVFSPRNGLANATLDAVGIGPQGWLQEPEGVFSLIASGIGVPWPGWLEGPSLALVAIMVTQIWHNLGFQIVIFLVGLGAVSRELYEAARVDGASERQVFFRITLPMISPTIFLVAVISTIDAFKEFTSIYVMSTSANVGLRPGGPLGTTETAVVYVLNQIYGANRYGYGAAVAMFLFMVILALTLFQLWVSRRWVRY